LRLVCFELQQQRLDVRDVHYVRILRGSFFYTLDFVAPYDI
jgi:hypothetical protein